MALFKVSKGTASRLPSALKEGHCWYTYDDSKFYIEYKDDDGVLQRKALNANDAETLSGASLATILNNNALEIPTSKAVFDAIGASQIVHVGPDMPTDPNIKVWINTAEEGTGVVPVLPRVSTITLAASGWTGDKNPWSQVITVNGVTENSKIDPQPTAIQIVELQDAEITLMFQNDNGVVTAWVIGNKPTQDYTMDVLITEVVRV
jgi:hypothetical protein